MKPGATTRPEASKVSAPVASRFCGYFANDAVFDGDIGYLIEILGRVDDPAIFDDELTHSAKTLSRTAMRTAMPFST